MARPVEQNSRAFYTSMRCMMRQCYPHMEDIVEDAKVEIHGYMTNTLQRAGMDALTKESLPLAIEHQEEET